MSPARTLDTYEGKDLMTAGGREVEEGQDEQYAFEMEVRKLSGKNRRRTGGWCARGCGSALRSASSGPCSPTTRASAASPPASPSAAEDAAFARL